jgi:hypothetical protein
MNPSPLHRTASAWPTLCLATGIATGIATVTTLAPDARAQEMVVSPVQSTTEEGSSFAAEPWGSNQPMHYMQVHSDLFGTPRRFTGLSWRMNAVSGYYDGTRRIDLEVYMGYTVPYDHIHLPYAQNYSVPRQSVLARKVINMGPQGHSLPPGPNAFAGMTVLFDQPFQYNGNGSFAWEALIYSNAVVGSWNTVDALQGSPGSSGSIRSLGQGCIATNQQQAMALGLLMSDWGGTVTLGFTLSSGPRSSATVLAVGSRNPNTPFPGLCSNLLTDVLLAVPVGTTDANGSIFPGGAATWFVENHWQNQTIFAQMHSADLSRPNPIPISNSNGLEIKVPQSDLFEIVPVSRLLNRNGQANAPVADFALSRLANFGAVTRFHVQ